MHPWDVLNLLDRGAFPSAPGLPLYAPHTSQWEQPWRCPSFASLAGAEPALGWQRSQGSWREKHQWTNRAELGQAFWPPSFNHQVVRVSSCTLGGCRDQQRFPTCSIFQTCLKSTVSSIRAWQNKNTESNIVMHKSSPDPHCILRDNSSKAGIRFSWQTKPKRQLEMRALLFLSSHSMPPETGR